MVNIMDKPVTDRRLTQPVTRRRLMAVYFFAMLAAAFTLIVRLELSPWIGDRPVMVIFFIPIVVSAYFGGIGPGLLATAVCAVGVDYYMIPPTHTFKFGRTLDLIQWLFMITGGVLASGLCEMLHRARRKADANWNLYAVTLASIGDAVITTDAEGRVTFLNTEAEKLTAWKNADAKGADLAKVFRIINEGTRQTVESPVKKVLRTGMVVGLANHTVLIAKDGTERIIDDSGAPIRMDDDKIIGVVLVFRDNTDKKRAEDALRRQERFLDETGHIAKVGGWEFDPLTGAGSWTDEVARIHDLDPSVRPSKEFGLSFYTPESRPKIEAAVKAAIEHGTPYDLELEIISAKGVRKWVRTICQPVKEANRVLRVSGAVQDITAQKLAEKALRESQALYHSLVNQIPAGIFRKDLEGRYVHVNDLFCKLRELRPEDLIGKTALEIGLPRELAQTGMDHHEQIIKTGITITAEESYERAGGGRIYFQVVKTPVFDADGKIMGSQGTLFDITHLKEAERALSRSESKFAIAFANNPAAIALTRLDDGLVLEINDTWEKLCGVPREEVVGRTARFMWPNNEDLKRFLHNLRTHGRVRGWEQEFKKRSGEAFIAKLWSQVLEFEGYQVLLSTLVDITAQKHAEKALIEAKTQIQYILDNTKDIIFQIDFQGNYKFGNAAAEQVTGYPLTQLLQMNMMQLVTPEHQAFLAERLRRRVIGEVDDKSFEFEIRHRDGHRLWLELTTSGVHDAEGKMIAIQGVARDITLRKETEAEHATLAAIVQNSEDAIISKSMDGIITSWNSGAEKIYGFTAKEAIGRPLLIIFPADRLHEEQLILGRISSGETVENFDTVRVRSDGRQINISTTIFPVRDAQGRISGAASISRDITERKKLEEQLRQSQKMEAIGQLSAGVAHDFNNLLTAIHGNASLLEDARDDERVECIAQIVQASERAADLTRQLLLFSRKQAMRFTNLDLNTTVANTTKMLRRVLGENITLRAEPGHAIPSIRADAGMIDQIIFNLAVNARDAMGDSSGNLTIRTSAGSAKNPDDEKNGEQPCVCLTISDTGHGIAPEILPRIFEPFFTTKEVGKGTGLGLATIYGIVKQHSGWITVESEVGHGTTFKVYFPASGDAAHETPPDMIFKHLPRGTETILLIEDEAPVRKFIALLLERLGYKVLSAEHGVATLELWPQQRDNVSLVITDIVMPQGIRGYELADKLLADKPSVRVIYMSGYASDTEPRRAMLVEGVNFIRKPFKPDAMAEIVRHNLDGKMA
jgi:PAS domain S-box-containing protein